MAAFLTRSEYLQRHQLAKHCDRNGNDAREQPRQREMSLARLWSD
jgi:hypothetical protein